MHVSKIVVALIPRYREMPPTMPGRARNQKRDTPHATRINNRPSPPSPSLATVTPSAEATVRPDGPLGCRNLLGYIHYNDDDVCTNSQFASRPAVSL